MMENPRSREKKIIKDIRNLFRLKKNKMTQQLMVVKGIKGKMIFLVIKIKFNQIVTELFIRGRKLNISIVFVTQSYFLGPKNIRLNSTHYFFIKF